VGLGRNFLPENSLDSAFRSGHKNDVFLPPPGLGRISVTKERLRKKTEAEKVSEAVSSRRSSNYQERIASIQALRAFCLRRGRWGEKRIKVTRDA